MSVKVQTRACESRSPEDSTRSLLLGERTEPLRHQLTCDQCRQAIPCFTWLHMHRTGRLPLLDVDASIAFAERGYIYNASVQACDENIVALSVDLGGIFVQRIVLLAWEGLSWIRWPPPASQTPQDAVEALLAANALVAS